MSAKVSDFFEELLHKNNPNNSWMGRIFNAIGWKNKRLKITIEHLSLIYQMLEPAFNQYVDENLQLLHQHTEDCKNVVIQTCLSRLKIGILHAPQLNCMKDFNINKYFRGYHFIGTIDKTALESRPLQRQKLLYYDNEQKGDSKTADVEDIFKQMHFAYISKEGLMRCHEDLFCIFNAENHKLIGFLDFSDKKMDPEQLSEYVEYVN